jgi:DNA-binding Xre family transcriptional regulator
MSVEIKTNHGNLHFMLDDYMKRYNMQVGELATLLDKKYNQTLNIKNGNINSISFEVLAIICNHFGIQPGQLLYSKQIGNDSIIEINKERKVLPIEELNELSENIKVDVHLLFALEEEYILYACPEVEIYGDFSAPKGLENLVDATAVVIEHFKDSFLKKKANYKSNSEFFMNMQQRQNWVLNDTNDGFIPMPLTYYMANYFSIDEMINKHKALILQIPLEIKIVTSN